MRRSLALAVAALILGSAGVAGTVMWPIGETPTLATAQGDVQRGAYLARSSGCIACHTNFEQGGAPLAGGVKLKTDFGTFYSPNLTADADHGIGGWAISDFAKAVRQGVSPEGDPYYPTFTYPFYANFTDQDIADLWAAFQTVPAVAQPSQSHDLSFPFDQRWSLKLWRATFLKSPNTAPVAGKSDVWNRGKKIVNGAAHCAACHTPRNILGARVSERYLSGSNALPGGGKSPDITAAALKQKGWTVSNLSYALRTGVTPEGDAFGGSMGEAVQQGLAFLSDEDLVAIATYILDAD